MDSINHLVEFLVTGSSETLTKIEPCLQPHFGVDSPIIQGVGSDALLNFRQWITDVGTELYCVNRVQPEADPLLVAIEFELELKSMQPSPLPVAMMIELKGESLGSLRVYHSLWALEGKHSVRDPLFKQEQSADTAIDVRHYHQALKEGDTQATLALFDPAGYAREPSGDRYGRRYDRALIDFFSGAFRDGGVGLIYHSFVQTPGSCAAEYTCFEWGDQSIPPQAGMEFWDRAPEGLFQAVRIYDDVSQPGI